MTLSINDIGHDNSICRVPRFFVVMLVVVMLSVAALIGRLNQRHLWLNKKNFCLRSSSNVWQDGGQLKFVSIFCRNLLCWFESIENSLKNDKLRDKLTRVACCYRNILTMIVRYCKWCLCYICFISPGLSLQTKDSIYFSKEAFFQ